MFEKISDYVIAYCMMVLSLLLGFIEKTHGIVAVGLPLLAMFAVRSFMPPWIGLALDVLIWIPAAMGMVIFLVSCWPHISQR